MPEEIDRQGWKKEVAELKKKNEELEASIKAILKGMVNAENELGEALMPKGIYHGYDFND